jgi:hypothetical protein
MRSPVAALAAGLLVVASTAVAQTPPPPPPPPASPPQQPPFPLPKLIQVTGQLKCDWGPIKTTSRGQIVLDTPAGPFAVLTGDARVVGPKPDVKIAPSALQPGQNVRVYYVVKDGARALEIDLIPPPPAAVPK